MEQDDEAEPDARHSAGLLLDDFGAEMKVRRAQ